MRRLLLLILMLSFGVFNIAHSQNKKASLPKPYSISNIQLGMSMESFKVSYPDSIAESSNRGSTSVLFYESLSINNIEATNVMVKFFKNKLIQLSLRTYDYLMHSGLSAKYGYKQSEEYTTYIDGEVKTLCGYGTKNDYYDLFRVTYESGEPEHFVMMDIKGCKLSDSEGF